jgi:hypothetical protein
MDIPAPISLYHNRIAAGASISDDSVKSCAYIQDYGQNATFNNPGDDPPCRKTKAFGTVKSQWSVALSTMSAQKVAMLPD